MCVLTSCLCTTIFAVICFRADRSHDFFFINHTYSHGMSHIATLFSTLISIFGYIGYHVPCSMCVWPLSIIIIIVLVCCYHVMLVQLHQAGLLCVLVHLCVYHNLIMPVVCALPFNSIGGCYQKHYYLVWPWSMHVWTYSSLYEI